MIQLLSNVKIITSGNKPTVNELLPGQAAFGKLTDDGKYHLYGNTGEGGDTGKVVDIILDTFDSIDKPNITDILTAGNITKLNMLFQSGEGENAKTTVTIGPAGITTTDDAVIEAAKLTNAGKVVLSANPSLQVSEEDAETMRGFLSVYSKAEIDAKLTSALHFKGSVDSFSTLPTTAEVGDVYNVKTAGGTDVHNNPVKAGDNVVYVAESSATGDTHPAGWDVLAGVVDLTNYYNKTEVEDIIDGKVSSAITNYDKDFNTKVQNYLDDNDYVADANYVHTDNNYTGDEKTKVAKIVTNGTGKKVLADDGTYKTLEIAVTSI